MRNQAVTYRPKLRVVTPVLDETEDQAVLEREDLCLNFLSVEDPFGGLSEHIRHLRARPLDQTDLSNEEVAYLAVR